MYVYDSFGNYVRVFGDKDMAEALPFPAPDANKYSRGKVVLISGSAAYPGAAIMCARATQLSGAGYTELFTAKRNVSIIQGVRPSLVVRSFKEFGPDALPSSHNPGALVFGPGIDESDPKARELLLRVIKKVDRPLLIDGGGLNLLSEPDIHKAVVARGEAGLETVLTPHPGEAARLGIRFGIEPYEDQARMAMELANCYKAVIVLKGPDTTICDGRYFVTVDEGTSALAKAGTGDVLAGIIGGFMAQRLTIWEACVLGVILHARAGVIASECLGPICVCADDLLDMFPTAIMNLSDSNEEE